MSNRSGHYSEYPQHHPHDHGRAFPRRPTANQAVAAAASQTQAASPSHTQEGYTLGPAGKQVPVRPGVFWIVVGSVTLLAMWSPPTATYFAFRDHLLTRL